MLTQIDQCIETMDNMKRVHKELYTVTNGEKFLESISLSGGGELKDEYETDEDYMWGVDTDIED